jgi:hypothetical protein
MPRPGWITGYSKPIDILEYKLRSAVSSYSPGQIQSNANYPVITIMGGDIEYTMVEGDDGWRYEPRKDDPPSIFNAEFENI